MYEQAGSVSRALVAAVLCTVALTMALTMAPAQAEPVDAGAAPQDLRFRDFFASPIGPRGLEMTAALKAADGKRVQLTGYMVAQEDAPTGHFFLTPLPLRMSEHADGDADDLPPSTVLVVMPTRDAGHTLSHTPGLLRLTGVLKVGRHQMDDNRVVWVRLLLDAPGSTVAASR
jgi:hypothetical protein